jgi:hypothetical protein
VSEKARVARRKWQVVVVIAKSIGAQGLDDASFSHARWARDAVTQRFF